MKQQNLSSMAWGWLSAYIAFGAFALGVVVGIVSQH
jgi:hypothetical protein